ncbi:MAG: sigma-70 family RNA polymerase sigma factor [Gemmatimonadota bacterium]
MEHPEDVTRLLDAWTKGDADAKERVFPILYEELKRLARAQLWGERADHTLDTTAVVHEAYLRLARLEEIEWRDRSHFFAAAAGAMRRVLIDYATMRNAAKRGGGRQPIPLDHAPPIGVEQARELLALDEALERLERLDARKARVVECRFFAGLTVEETAEALDVSPVTVRRDWTTARAWLNRELSA